MSTPTELAPHQVRVMQEKEDLAARLDSLTKFIEQGDTYPTLHPEEQRHLRIQQFLMTQYCDVLKARIEFWSRDPHSFST